MRYGPCPRLRRLAPGVYCAGQQTRPIAKITRAYDRWGNGLWTWRYKGQTGAEVSLDMARHQIALLGAPVLRGKKGV